MQLPSSKLSPTLRSATRFTVVGSTGTILQYVFYALLLDLADVLWPEAEMVSACFTLAFLLEMVTNYLLTNYYTFQTKPNLKNSGGYLMARGICYVLQMGFLHLLMLVGLGENWSGILAIILAGIANYMVCRLVFKKK